MSIERTLVEATQSQKENQFLLANLLRKINISSEGKKICKKMGTMGFSLVPSSSEEGKYDVMTPSGKVAQCSKVENNIKNFTENPDSEIGYAYFYYALYEKYIEVQKNFNP